MCESFEQQSTSSQHEQHWDSADSETEVSSCCAHEEYQQQMKHMVPLHRVKRVWSHLCMLEELQSDCFDA
jgi:hypothetical protein